MESLIDLWHLNRTNFILRFWTLSCVVSLFLVLILSTLSESAKLRALHTLVPTRLTHYYASCLPCALYVPACLHAFTLINNRLCLVLLQIPLCLPAPVQKKFNMMRIFSFGPEAPFLDKFGPKIKITSLSWNLVPRPIQIRRIQWWCLLFLFSTRNTQKTKLSV